MEDTFGRKIDYIRISVTDRCNLRCKYCMPNGMENVYTCDEIMSYEEILRICKNLVAVGITKFKITGGEPLARIGIDDFIIKLKSMEGVKQVTLTTNGVLLDKHLDALKKAGIDGINISLDTLDPKRYEEITGFNALDKVLSSIDKAYDMGIKIKINAVPVRQYNINEITKLEAIAKDQNFMSAVSHKFCSEWNRIRLTSYGDLKLCLCYDYGVNLKDLIRNKKLTDEELKDVIKKEILKKPKQHSFEHMEDEENIENKNMFQIGG